MQDTVLLALLVLSTVGVLLTAAVLYLARKLLGKVRRTIYVDYLEDLHYYAHRPPPGADDDDDDEGEGEAWKKSRCGDDD